MSKPDLRNRKLVELYYRYVGEPERMRDVYGYWLFLLGCLAGLVGVLIFQFEQAVVPGDLGIRQVAIVLSAFGLAIALFGIVVLLPVRRRGILASIVGLAIAFVGIGAFTWAYPTAWYVPPDYSAEIIAVYTLGIAIVAGVAVLVPIVTGEKGLLVEPELGIGKDEPPVLVGETTRDAFFAVYKRAKRDWMWRIIQRDAIAETARNSATDTDARLQIEAVREMIGEAGLLDLTTSSFRLYRTDDGEWRWSLVRDDGSAVAQSDEPAPDRDTVESTVTFLKEHIPDAEILDIRGAAFDVYSDRGDRWRWRLVDDQRRPLAQIPDSVASESAAEGAIETFVDRIEDSRALSLEDIGFELFEADDGWRWRVVDAEDEHLVSSAASFPSRGDAESAVETRTTSVDRASIVEAGQERFEIVTGEEWTWRLRDDADDVVAHGVAAASTEATARSAAERTQAVLPEATTVEFEGVEYEVYPADGSWHWRLVSHDRAVLAGNTEPFDDREVADEAANRVRDQALTADLIEFDQAAFQQYESGGDWRWRLIDEDGRVMADSGEAYESKEAVREGMRTLKEHAPDAEVLEIDTAAFEIYRGESDAYTWRLIDEGGRLIAESASDYPSRAEAREAVTFLLDHLEAASVRSMDVAAFQLLKEDDTWSYRLIHPDGTILAESAREYSTRDDLLEGIERTKSTGAAASIDTFGPTTVLLHAGEKWHWQLVDPDLTVVGHGERTYETRAAAIEDATRLIEHASHAPTFHIGEGIFWLDEREGTWRWRLVTGERDVLAVSGREYDSEEAALEAITHVRSRGPDAGRFEIDTLAFELVTTDDGWRWRLLDEQEAVLGRSPVAHDERDGARDSIERVRSVVTEASILEIDEAIFEFQERDDGWIWRLIDEHGAAIAQSVETHDSRQAAYEEMLSAKDHAPEGETVITW